MLLTKSKEGKGVGGQGGGEIGGREEKKDRKEACSKGRLPSSSV